MLAILAITFCLGMEFSLAERNLTDKTVVITGAARGIGKAIADCFLENGAERIIIVDKNGTNGVKAAEALTSKYGENKAVFKLCDIRTDLEETLEYILENFGCPDILVNDAGILDENDPVGMLNTNLVALAEWSIAFNELMRVDHANSSSSRCGNGGFIMNIASVDGHTADPFFFTYKASKFAVTGLTKCMGHRFNEKQTGVTIVAVSPDKTNTSLSENVVVPKNQLQDMVHYYASRPGQEPDAVGRGAVKVYKNAESGTIWDIAHGNDPVLASDLKIATLEDIISK